MRNGIQGLVFRASRFRHALLAGIVVAGVAIQGQAETTGMTGTMSMSLRIGGLPAVKLPSNGAVSVLVSSGGFVEPTGVFGPTTPTTVALPKSLFTGVPQISGLTLAGWANGTQVVNCGTLPCTATGGLRGNSLVNILQLFNLTIPLSVVGQPGAIATDVSGGIEITVIGQGWTAGTAVVTGLTETTPGTAIVNTVTQAGSDQRSAGKVTLVSGFKMITNIRAGTFPGFVVQSLSFPGFLPDGDGDGTPDFFDNCPETPNASQTDADQNGVGDRCNDFEDLDGDDWADGLDNCPSDSNQDQADTDENGLGDACNDFEDLDGDEWGDSLDNCPDDSNVNQTETDGDGVGDACDPYPADSLNLQGLVDLEAAQSTILGLQGDLSSCESDAAQCSTDLSQSQAAVITCNGDLSSCIGTATQLEADLVQTQADLSQAQSDITLLQAEVSQLGADLEETESLLADAVADTDADGVRDTADACPSTAADAQVDFVGCSQVQFCTAVDVSTGPGKATCNNADWMNDEARAQNPEDCKAKQGLCEAIRSG